MEEITPVEFMALPKREATERCQERIKEFNNGG